MSKGKGSDFGNRGPVGRAAEAVCLSTLGPAKAALCAEVGRKADAAVNHRDNNSGSNHTSASHNNTSGSHAWVGLDLSDLLGDGGKGDNYSGGEIRHGGD